MNKKFIIAEISAKTPEFMKYKCMRADSIFQNSSKSSMIMNYEFKKNTLLHGASCLGFRGPHRRSCHWMALGV